MVRLRVAFVTPLVDSLESPALQADRLLRAWQDDPAVDARVVRANPVLPALRRVVNGVKHFRTTVNRLTYVPLPAMCAARALGRPDVLNYRHAQASEHLSRCAPVRHRVNDCPAPQQGAS